ncbi:MAG: hypothetical protein GXO91_09895 [FCB group bacterium]|nr:hypothetical protein [FCB group bacterium]
MVNSTAQIRKEPGSAASGRVDYEIISRAFEETKNVWGQGTPTAEDIRKLLDKRENWIEILKKTEKSRQETRQTRERSDRTEFYNVKIKEILKKMTAIDESIMAYFNTLKSEKIKEISKITDIQNRRRQKRLIFEQNEERRIVDIQQE